MLDADAPRLRVQLSPLSSPTLNTTAASQAGPDGNAELESGPRLKPPALLRPETLTLRKVGGGTSASQPTPRRGQAGPRGPAHPPSSRLVLVAQAPLVLHVQMIPRNRGSDAAGVVLLAVYGRRH